MRRVEFDQGSPEWLQWRRGLLTATDAPMLMGVSPYVTPYKGWQRKLGLIEEQAETEPMRRGKRDEPIARDLFIQQFDLEMEPCCVESDSYNFIGSSLDGLSICGKYLLEIKSNGDQYHYNLDYGIPEFHMMQMQHQFLSTDNSVELGFYVSYNKGNIIVKEIRPDPDFLEKYLVKARDFWKKIVLFEPPSLSSKDYKDMQNDQTWSLLSQKYSQVCNNIKIMEEQKELIRREIIGLCGDESCCGNGIKVLKKVTKGRVDYESIPELSNLNLDKYRKSSTMTWTIMLDQK